MKQSGNGESFSGENSRNRLDRERQSPGTETNFNPTVMEPTSCENRQVSDTILYIVANDLDTLSWKILARHLGIPEIDIKSMDKENRPYIVMLKEWKRRRGDEATVRVLRGALEKTGRGNLSEKVKEFIRGRPEEMKTEMEKETKMVQKMSLDRAYNKNEDKTKRKTYNPILTAAVPPNSPPLVLSKPSLLDAPKAAVSGPIGTVAEGTAATSPAVPEEDCTSLIGQMAVGQDVPELVAPRQQAPSLEAPAPHLPGHNHVPTYDITIDGARNAVIGNNNNTTFNTASTDANAVFGDDNHATFGTASTDAPLNQAPTPEPSGAAVPAVPLNQASSPCQEAQLPAGRGVSKYSIKIGVSGNAVIGNNNTATFGTATTDEPLNPAPPPEPSGAAVPVSKYDIKIGRVGNTVVGDNNTAIFGTASTDGQR